MKKLIREIVLSHTWQLAVDDPHPGAALAPATVDPDNRLLAHANRRRFDAEELRDTMLSVSGALQLDVDGPNIAGAGEIDPDKTSAQDVEYQYQFNDTRRSVYTPAFRNKRLELFEVFDFGDINAPMGRRTVSTVAPQALYLLNHPFVIAQARLAAEQALASTANDADRLTAAFRTALGRPPTDRERATATQFLTAAANDPQRLHEAWAQLYQTLFDCLTSATLE